MLVFAEWIDDALAVPRRVKEILTKMADESAVIQQIADALNDRVFPSVSALITENLSLRQQIADQEGVELAESQAASNAKDATDQLVEILKPSDLPTVNPLDVPQQ